MAIPPRLIALAIPNSDGVFILAALAAVGISEPNNNCHSKKDGNLCALAVNGFGAILTQRRKDQSFVISQTAMPENFLTQTGK